MLRVFSAAADLVSLIGGSFSKTCSSGLHKAQDVPLIVF